MYSALMTGYYERNHRESEGGEQNLPVPRPPSISGRSFAPLANQRGSMSETAPTQVLPLLIELSKLDGRIALLQAQLKKIDEERKVRTQNLTTLQAKRDARAKIQSDKKALVAREEKGIKLEREKIHERRRALSTLNNYKLQQAAEREIEYVSKQIGQREDLLLGLMREVEVLDKELQEADTLLQGMRDEMAAFDKSSTETVSHVSEDLRSLQADRTTQAQGVGNPQILTTYSRIVARFPSDPIVDVVNKDSCSGCFMKVGPQVTVQISRGDVVKCPGCGRILKLPREQV
jgi:predicted  nucleic acid-binding Zn-ribbon protein